jgi:acyl carrier protein
MDVETKVRTMLLPVFGIESVDEILPSHSLVRDLGAESLDFVEIVFLVEKEFGVKLETKEIVSGGALDSAGNLFNESRLTDEGESIIRMRFPENPERFTAGMSKMDIFQTITVGDLVCIIKSKIGG